MSINLLPWRAQRQKHQNFLFYSAGVFTIATILSCLVLLRFLILTQLKQLALRPVFHGNHDHQTVVWLQKISRHQQVIARTLIRIGQEIPPQCQLTQLAQHKNKITITGRVERSQQITLFIRRLQSIQSLQAVTLKKITQRDTIYFIIQAIIRA